MKLPSRLIRRPNSNIFTGSPGFVGAVELHEWFTGLAATLPTDARARREGVVGFLGVWSTGLYVVVAPVLVYQLLVTFGPVGF